MNVSILKLLKVYFTGNPIIKIRPMPANLSLEWRSYYNTVLYALCNNYFVRAI
jgi:hypothetical protein